MQSIFSFLNNFFFSSHISSFICLVDRYQLNLSDPATPIMFGIHNLHNHILFFLCMILAAVLFLLFSVLFFFSFYADKFYNFQSIKKVLLFLISSSALPAFAFSAVSKWNAILKSSANTLFSIWPLSPLLLIIRALLTFAAYFFLTRVPIFLMNGFCNLFSQIIRGLRWLNTVPSEWEEENFISTKEFPLPSPTWTYALTRRYMVVILSTLNLSSYLSFSIFTELRLFFNFIAFNRKGKDENKSYDAVLNFVVDRWEYAIAFKFEFIKSFCNWFFSFEFGNQVAKFFHLTFNTTDAPSSNESSKWLAYLINHKQYRITHDLNLEIIWTLIPTVILIFIAIPSFALLYSMDELLDPSITIKVIGHQWYWSYEYTDFRPLCNQTIKFDSYMVPDADLAFGDLRLLKTDCPLILPKETNIRFLITATDVLHSWAVPSFGIKMDAVPGRLNQTSTYIMENGRYYGQCSELCGVNHAFMPIEICVIDPKDYYNWVFFKVNG
jgi:cytochrome c oxidase subunit 2